MKLSQTDITRIISWAEKAKVKGTEDVILIGRLNDELASWTVSDGELPADATCGLEEISNDDPTSREAQAARTKTGA